MTRDIKRFKAILNSCYKLMKGRNAKYGSSWKELEPSSIVDLTLMKLVRIKKQNLKSSSIKEEAKDCINYLVFLLMKIKK